MDSAATEADAVGGAVSPGPPGPKRRRRSPKSRTITLRSLWLGSTFSPSIPGRNRGTRLPLSAVDAINPAFRHAKQQLIQPFRFGQWVRLAFVGLLAGEMGSGGGCNFSVTSTHQGRGSEHLLSADFPPGLTQHPALLIGSIALLVVVGFGLFALFLYINSVMRFILFDSVVARKCHIRKGWADRRQHGRRFFVWQILFTLASLAGFAILIGVPLALAWTFGWLGNPSEHVLPLVLGGIALFFLLIALAALLAVVHVMTKDFVVPQMALENISALEGWRRLWPWLKAEKGGYSGYVGMKIVLAIAAGIAFAIIAMVALLVLLIPLGGFGAVAVLGGKAVGLTWNFYTIALAVLVGCIALAILMFAISLLSVPVIVFFPAYSVYFFAARYVPLAALLWPPPPASFQPPLPFTPPALT